MLIDYIKHLVVRVGSIWFPVKIKFFREHHTNQPTLNIQTSTWITCERLLINDITYLICGSKSAHLGDELISILFIEASRLRWVCLHFLQPALKRKRRLLSIIQLTKRPITHSYFGFKFALIVSIIFFTLYIGWHNRLIIKNFNLHTTKFIFNNKLYCIIYLFIRTL